jgi:hypothetical protein
MSSVLSWPREKADFDRSTAAKDEEGRICLERLFSAQFHAHVGGDEVFVSLVGESEHVMGLTIRGQQTKLISGESRGRCTQREHPRERYPHISA